MKTSELIGPALDWAVASIEGVPEWFHNEVWVTTGGLFNHVQRRPYNPSEKWSQGGPIIEREKIFIVAPYRAATSWKAYKMELDQPELPCWLEDGPAPLIAAMRCYVASKLGDEVKIPQELLK